MSGTRGRYSPEIGSSNYDSRQREIRREPGVDWVNRILPVSAFEQARKELEGQIHFIKDRSALHSTDARPSVVPYWVTNGQVFYIAPKNLVAQIEHFKRT